MNSKIKIILGILIMGIILVGGYVILNTPKEVEVEFPIDSEEEAIAYAKTDPEVKEFIKGWSNQEFYKNAWAAWDPNRNIWEVGISPFLEEGARADFLFVIRFKPDGSVIEKGIELAA